MKLIEARMHRNLCSCNTAKLTLWFYTFQNTCTTFRIIATNFTDGEVKIFLNPNYRISAGSRSKERRRKRSRSRERRRSRSPRDRRGRGARDDDFSASIQQYGEYGAEIRAEYDA